jgi:hypothetical protein
LAISFGSKPKEEDVVSLIAAKKYARAIELLKAQVSKKGANPSLRMQLADVLILAEKTQEAIALLLPLADQYAKEGFAAKAVSVLKKVQRIDPGRRDVDTRLARLIEEKQREAVLPLSRPTPAFGIEEIGSESPVLEIGFSGGPISAPVDPSPGLPSPDETLPVDSALLAPPPMPPSRVKPALAPEPEPEPPFPPVVPVSLPTLAPPPPPVPVDAFPPLPTYVPPPPPPTLVEPEPLPVLTIEPEPVTALPVLEAEPPAGGGGVEDYDLLYAGDEDDDLGLTLEAEPVEAEPATAEPMSAGQFADELMSLVDSVFQEFPDAPAAPAAPKGAEPPRGGSQIVVSPLFRDFSVDEMVAVIEGLRLVTLDRGDVILREGQPGGSLYMLTSGRVRAFKKDPSGTKQNPIGDLKEGAFFGEMSILTGHPRMASVVALTRCELLELDRPTLDQITATHPHVWDVLREFADQRAAQTRG